MRLQISRCHRIFLLVDIGKVICYNVFSTCVPSEMLFYIEFMTFMGCLLHVHIILSTCNFRSVILYVFLCLGMEKIHFTERFGDRFYQTSSLRTREPGRIRAIFPAMTGVLSTFVLQPYMLQECREQQIEA